MQTRVQRSPMFPWTSSIPRHQQLLAFERRSHAGHHINRSFGRERTIQTILGVWTPSLGFDNRQLFILGSRKGCVSAKVQRQRLG